MINLIFLHGFFSSPQSTKIQNFLKVLPTTELGNKIASMEAVDLYPTQADFEQMTVSSLVDKISNIMDRNEYPSWIIGSSHGGLLALASYAANSQRIKGLVILAPAINYYNLLSRRHDIEKWKEQGFLEVDYYRFKGKTKWSYEYYQDLKNYREWGEMDIPILIIHGKRDDLIPVKHSRLFASKQPDCTEYYPAEGVHNLGNVISELTDLTLHWLVKRVSVI